MISNSQSSYLDTAIRLPLLTEVNLCEYDSLISLLWRESYITLSYRDVRVIVKRDGFIHAIDENQLLKPLPREIGT